MIKAKERIEVKYLPWNAWTERYLQPEFATMPIEAFEDWKDAHSDDCEIISWREVK